MRIHARALYTALFSLGLVVTAACDSGGKNAGGRGQEASPANDAKNAPAKPVLGAGRTPPPTLEEWSSMRKEVTVKGSSALNCETKIVREYLRVSCRGKNDSGGTPTSLRIVKGGRGEAYTFASGGVTSLVVPFVSGTDLEAEFSWTDKSHKLAVKWPRGAPMPQVVGVFEGAKSPLDGNAGPLADRLCECHKKVRGVTSCEDMFGGSDPDCQRTYGSDCDMLLACSRGEPGAFPKCETGFVNAGAIGRCMRTCGADKVCPPGLTCVDDLGPTPVCAE
jgi:hypothetical protein